MKVLLFLMISARAVGFLESRRGERGERAEDGKERSVSDSS
jgi:hypothetical protein